MATAAKEPMAEIEKRTGRPVKVRARAKERAVRAAKILQPLMSRGRNGVTPFPSARTRVALHAVKPRGRRELKGVR